MSEEYKGDEQGYEGDGPNVRLDDFVGRIVQDPSQPPELLLLSGYLGASSEEGHVRLYLDEELSRYVELPEKAIRHTQELPPEQSPLGGSLVWLDRGAEVLHGSATEERRKATFLEGQIAQDFIGAAGGQGGGEGGEGARQEVGGEAGVAAQPRTQLFGCQSALNPCTPPTEFGPNCVSRFQICQNTLTGIFCTRFGPGCRRTIFEPACTAFGPSCRTVLINQCLPSVASPCITRNSPDCRESGFVPCNPPVDFTIWQGQFGGQAAAFGGQVEAFGGQQAAAFAGPGGGGGGFGGGGGGVFQTGFNCPSVFDNCATRESFCPTQTFSSCPSAFFPCFTRSPVQCQIETRFCPSVVLRCPTEDFRCQTQTGPRCLVSRIVVCSDTRTGPGCVVGSANCPTLDPRCQISQVAACGQTLDCPLQTARCGFDAGFGAQEALQATGPVTGTETKYCPSQVASCRTQTQGVPCASAVDACPTRLGCQTQRGCPADAGGGGGGGAQAFGAEGFGAEGLGAEGFGGGAAAIRTQQVACFPSQFIRCPSAVDACPTRFNCPSQFVPCQSQFNRCPSALDACPTRFNCPSVTSPCVTQDFSCETRGRCPSAVDACPTRFGCFDTQVCGISRACFPGGGGGFNPGGGGGGF